MLVQRRRRWPNIKLALVQGVVLAGTGNRIFEDKLHQLLWKDEQQTNLHIPFV